MLPEYVRARFDDPRRHVPQSRREDMSRAPRPQRKNRKGKSGHSAPAAGSAGRLIVTYLDGSWTDNLAVERYAVVPEAGELVLSIEVVPRERPGKVRAARQALSDFVAKLGRVHTLQIGKPLFVTQVRNQVRGLEHSGIGVKLSANGRDAAYPAGLAFGPDEVTLNLG